MQALPLICVVGLYRVACELVEYLVVRRHAVASGWQEERLAFSLFTPIWTFMGTTVTVTSREGDSTQHGLVNRKQGLFLDALRRYLPSDAFDAGLYDWHP
jgi:hypothetical protein